MTFEVGAARTRRVTLGGHTVRRITLGSDEVYHQPRLPVISGYGITLGLPGTARSARATLRERDLPNTPRISATLGGDVTSWSLSASYADAPIAAGAAKTDGTYYTAMEHVLPAVTTSLRPPAAGWTYVLAATNADGTATVSMLLRSTRPPSITQFAASAPAASQGPGIFIQCTTFTANVYTGDPPADWSMSQAGPVAVPHLPSGRHLPPPAANGPRVCITTRAGRYTDFTLRGVNEDGAAEATARADWISGP